MKRVILTTTSLVFAGGMAAADVSLTGSGELGVADGKDMDAKLHRDIQVVFSLSGATDTGLSFGAKAKLHETADSRTGKQSVHISVVFGTLTLGDTDGAFDKALTEVGSDKAVTDDHTGHVGYDGNSGLDGTSGNGGNILRYDYSLGAVTASLSGEFGADISSDTVLGACIAWSVNLGGVGIEIGVGYLNASTDTMATDDAPAKTVDASIVGTSVKVEMGGGLSMTANASRKDHDENGATTKTAHTAVGVAYAVDALTIGVNGGQKSMKGATVQIDSGVGFAEVYDFGGGAKFQVGVDRRKRHGESEYEVRWSGFKLLT